MEVVLMALSIYREQVGRTRQQSLSCPGGSAVFAEVIVDIPARELGDKLFSYRIPDFLQSEVFIGTQVLVPFGAQELVGGYVVSLKDQLDGEFKTKDIIEVIDNEPLFDQEYIAFLYWIAEYYCASLSSVISAAVPSDFGPRLKRVANLVSAEHADALNNFNDVGLKSIVQALAQSNKFSLSLRALRIKTKLKQAHFYRCLSTLKQQGIIEVRAESSQQLAPKTVKSVVWTGQAATSPRQENIVALLSRHGGQMQLSQLLESARTTRDTIAKMAQKGIVNIVEQEILRDPLKNVSASETPHLPELTSGQQKVWQELKAALQASLQVNPDNNGHPVQPWLLHGVTGSGKTEIYLRLIQEALDQRRTAMLLVPEISLTPQLAERLKSRFGHQVAIWHSALSAGERYDTWRRLRAGDVKVLLGARSAILASMPNLGLIIIDEEHDGSYKQSSPNPRYHAKKLALEQARRTGSLVLLGSATPDVGSYRDAVSQKRLLSLPDRIFQQAMPTVKIVDMRQEFKKGNRSIFSKALKDALSQCLEQKQQAILLMNRRGYASHVFCRACGYVVKCRNCSVSMVYHQAQGSQSARLECHHCAYNLPAQGTCPNCLAPFLRPFGLGTQKVEEELHELFPEVRSLRLDSDVTARRGAFQEIFKTFSNHQADVLIGTQMVAKGLDIPNVTVVGVLAADAAFNLPDYRSMERGFQLLTQVAGRAGRGNLSGQVVMQTYSTELPALVWAKDHNYLDFAQQELSGRENLEYPPFSQIIRLVVTGADGAATEANSEKLAEELTNYLADEIPLDSIKVLGPAPCLIERLRGKYRYHLLLKNLAGEKGQHLITSFLRHKRLNAELTLAVDVDAFDLI